MYELVEKHRRYLPHFQEEGQVIHLTWRLEGTLPQQILALVEDMRSIMSELDRKDKTDSRDTLYQEYLQKTADYDEQLGKHKPIGINLSTPDNADIITRAFHYYDGKLYNLLAYCVMPNHVHLLIQPLEQESGCFSRISETVKRIKSYTSKQIKALNHCESAVWRADYFDRYIRDEKDMYNVVTYILNNPLKAGLAEEQTEWPYSYCRS